MSLKRRLTQLATGLEAKVDDLMFDLRSRLGNAGPLQIVPYRSYGTLNRLYVRGRVLEDKKIRKATAGDNLFQKVMAMYQRFESDEVPGARLAVTVQGRQ
ncbi:MAG TPA: hypothetical protein VGD65_21115, partial [Chryseosolibacter sp.]